nr:MAG TPA: nuclease [Caudoviricetes sp.]
MPNIFEATDRCGIRIYCTKDQWDNHVALNHEIMAENIDAIVETIQDPDVIYPSHDTNPPLDDRRIYTKESKIATYYPKIKYTHVIATICGGSGEVITAYPNNSKTSGAGGGEAIYVAEDEIRI